MHITIDFLRYFGHLLELNFIFEFLLQSNHKQPGTKPAMDPKLLVIAL